MRRKGQVARCGTDRTALVRVWLDRTAHQQAHDASHEAALHWDRLVEWLRAYWVERVADPGFKELRAFGDGLKLAPLHSQSVQAIAEDLDDAVRTYRSNKKLGLVGKAPWRLKKYRPVSFTRNYGWRVTPEGKLALSYGRGRERILLPAPVFTDPLTGVVVPPGAWGEIKLCWDRQARAWYVHVAYKTQAFNALPQGGLLDRAMVVVAVDPGIINSMTLAAPDGTGGFDVLVINGREIRSMKRFRNKKTGSLQKALARCRQGSRRHRKLTAAKKRLQAKTDRKLRNANHHVTKHAATFIRNAAIDTTTGEIRPVAIAMGDVRGIEQKTRTKRRASRHLRQQLSQWSRGQQDTYLVYKTGLKLDYIPEHGTTKTCPKCLHRRASSPKGRTYNCTNQDCRARFHGGASGGVNIHSRATNADGEIRPGPDPNQVRVTYQRAIPLKGQPAVEAHEQGRTRTDRASDVTSRTSTPQAA